MPPRRKIVKVKRSKAVKSVPRRMAVKVKRKASRPVGQKKAARKPRVKRGRGGDDDDDDLPSYAEANKKGVGRPTNQKGKRDRDVTPPPKYTKKRIKQNDGSAGRGGCTVQVKNHCRTKRRWFKKPRS